MGRIKRGNKHNVRGNVGGGGAGDERHYIIYLLIFIRIFFY